jgi:chemotaxis protein MotB
MTTFADLSTLLLTFFVLMLSMANIDIQKFRELLGSVKDAFGVQIHVKGDYQAAINEELIQKQTMAAKNTTESAPKSPSGAFSESSERFSDQQEAIDEIRNAINQTNMGEMADIRGGIRGIRMRIKGALLFDAGKAELRPQAFPLLNSLSDVMYRRDYYLLVEGHTDAIPISTERFPSNWELSGARAAAVLRHLIAEGIDSKRLTCVGLAASYPLADNDTEQGRAANRRVEFVLTKQPFRPEIN